MLVRTSCAALLLATAFATAACGARDRSGAAPVHAVILTRVGSNAPEVLKALREITGLGLADAEALAEGAPSVLRSGLSFDAALQLANRLTAAGADVDLRVD